MDGYTLVVDFPVTQATMRLADKLDRIVIASGGRLCLAKDSRQTRVTLEAGYPGLEAFGNFAP